MKINFTIGDIVLAVKPTMSFEQYEGTLMSVSGKIVNVKWVHDPNGDTLEYSPAELKTIS